MTLDGATSPLQLAPFWQTRWRPRTLMKSQEKMTGHKTKMSARLFSLVLHGNFRSAWNQFQRVRARARATYLISSKAQILSPLCQCRARGAAVASTVESRFETYNVARARAVIIIILSFDLISSRQAGRQ